jgi:lipoprotein-anchoring transpeptidase ErfK/SrfK
VKRSRRRTSRGLIALLTIALAVTAVCIMRRSMRPTGADSPPPAPNLSVIDVGGGSTDVPTDASASAASAASSTDAQTRPSAQLAAATESPAPLIETSTPSASGAGATPLLAVPPVTQPSSASSTSAASSTSSGGSWSQLLSGGSANGTPPPNLAAPKPGPIVTGNGPLADGRARLSAGQFLEARSALTDALQSGKLSDSDVPGAKALLSEINQTVIFSPRVISGDPFVLAYSVRQGDSLAKIAAANGTTWELLSRINHLDPRRLRYGTTIKVIRGPFFAVVTKKTFTMDIYLGGLPDQKGSTYVESFVVGLGKDDSTPTGLWAIAAHAKLRHPTYYPPEGGSPIDADDPKNPLGGYWIGLTGVEGQAAGQSSYGIHGTIEPDSIGKQASMGCIRLRNDDIAQVFDLMSEGKSKVLVRP